MFSKLGVLVRIAIANIFSNLLNLFVGAVLLFGAALLVIGGSLFSTLDDSLSRSIVDSITGHLQVYGARSKDPLEIYGKIDGSDSNLAPLDDFKTLKASLLALPNVDRVVPMGAATALISSGNTVDVTLEKLRALHRNQADAATRVSDAEFAKQRDNLVQHVRNIVMVLAKDAERATELGAADSILPEEREAVARASSTQFWDTFDEDPFGHLELLENRIAPLVADSDMLFIRYLGTDLDAYQSTFARMTIIEGQPVPAGHRGILLPRYFNEEYLKLRNARRLDKIREAREAGRRLADQSDKDLQRFVRENQAQTREIVLQLDGLSTPAAVKKLQGLLKTVEPDLAPLLTQFFGVDDTNFDERYRFFYAELAPMLKLYRVKVGDPMTLTSFGRSGSLESATVTLYGIFEIKGLEKSPLAGANALVDMITFRDLYGFLTADRKAEADAMKAATKAKQVSREDAEAELFGDSAEVVEQVKAKAFDEGTKPAGTDARRRTRRSDTFPPSEIDDGVVLNAAILLKDGSALAQLRTRLEIEQLLSRDKPPPDPQRIAAAKALVTGGTLPLALSQALSQTVALEETRAAGQTPATTSALLGLQAALKTERASLDPKDIATVEQLLASARPRVWVVGWSDAAGFLGKFIDFFRLALLGIVSAFAFIALIVVTIGMTIATLQRTATIGVMRAIGAQRTFVVSMVLVETVVLALVFGLAGALVGAGVVKYLHATGIPAFRDELYFFFSGPALRPELTATGMVLAVVVTLVVSVLAVLFPTWLATRVTPVTAMRQGE